MTRVAEPVIEGRTLASPGTDVAGDGTESLGSSCERVAIARSRAVRWWLVGVGVTCVALGGIGAVVPGLPTTVFLLIASWCFMRSCPVLERVLIRNRFFEPFVRYLRPGAVMPVRARVVSTAVMWTAVGISGWLLFDRGAPVPLVGVVAASAVAGTVMVWRIAREPRGVPAGS